MTKMWKEVAIGSGSVYKTAQVVADAPEAHGLLATEKP